MTAKREMFRPSFTLSELRELISYIPEESPIKKKVAVYLFKVDVGLNSAAYVSPSKESQTLAAKLGLVEIGDSSGKSQSELYTERLQQKQELAPATLSKEDKFNLLAAKAFAGKISEEEKEEGRALEQELYGMDMGTFASQE